MDHTEGRKRPHWEEEGTTWLRMMRNIAARKTIMLNAAIYSTHDLK